MPIKELYHNWKEKLSELRPQERVTRLRNFSWLLVGLYYGRSIHQSRIAAKIPGNANLPSKTRRLGRLLDNAAVRVREWYQPIACDLLQSLAASGEIQMIVDASKVGFGKILCQQEIH